MTITDARLRPEANNLTLVRLVLASAVILTHCYWRTTGIQGADDLSGFLGVPLSVYAVDGFFFLSGFLVYQSLGRRGPADFLIARLARLWPALAVAVIGTVLIGLAITTAPASAYLRGDTARFLGGNLSLAFGAYTLTGVQCDGGPCNVNGSLWTLPWEARCYLLLVGLGLTGLAGRRAMLWFVLPATVAFALLWHVPAVQALVRGLAGDGAVYLLDLVDRLWTLFAAGIAASLLRERIRLNWLILLALFAANLLAHRLGLGLHVRTLFIGYAVLCCGFLSARRGAVSGRWPDYSYGMYIYAFPVMMAIAALWPTRNYLALSAANFLLTLPLAALSWHYVEKPVLDRVKRLRARRAAARPPLGDASRQAAD
ncbi:MAG: acyltransferase [Sphingomonas sp.]